jgi:cardiolipin synthase
LVDLRRRQRRGLRAAYAWPAGLAVALGARYATESLRHRRESGHGYDLHGADELDVRDPGFLRAAEALTGAPISTGDDVELLINGDAIFPVYLETIRGAQRTLCLLTYVYWRGDIARDVADALCERARAGVEVNVIIDAMGGVRIEKDLVEQMAEAGVRMSRFRPPKPYAARRVANRTHRKILVADGEVGLTGGVGIAEEWTGDAQDPDHWRDTHVRVRGPVVRGLFGAFAENWLEATGEVLAGEGYLPDIPERENGGPMMVVRSSASVGDTNVEALYYLAIAAARETLDLTAAYFVPRPAFTDALVDAAERGVRVRVLVPGPNIDKPPVWVAGRELRRAGRRRGGDLRVPADDAACQVDGRRRRVVVGRLGQLRQPLVPAPRRGDAVRALGRVRRRAHGAVRARPRALGADRAGALEGARAAAAGCGVDAQAGPAGALGVPNGTSLHTE